MALLMPCMASGQTTFTAGQVSGEHIIYHDIDDLFISSPYWNSSDYEYMDLNDDGVDDLYLRNDFIYYSHIELMSASAMAEALGALEFSTLTDNPDWIKKHITGDVIGPHLQWFSDPGLIYRVESSSGSSGSFTGEGYMAYRICGTDTIYGWIRLYNSVSYDGANMTVYEFAYLTNNTGLFPPEEDLTGDIFRISGGSLHADLHDKFPGNNCGIKCYDLSGKLIFQFKPEPGINQVDISGYDKGLYLLMLTDDQGRTFTSKMIF
jgi:hypothetical protein